MLLAQNSQKSVGAAQPPPPPERVLGRTFWQSQCLSKLFQAEREKERLSSVNRGLVAVPGTPAGKCCLSVCQVAHTGLPVWNCWVSTAARQLEALAGP